VIDSSHVRAVKGRLKTGPSPVDRAKPGSKHHLITDAHGIPLPVSLTGPQRNDVAQLIPLITTVPPVRGRPGRPRQRPEAIYADRGYDHDKYRRQVRDKGITPVIARRGTEHGSGLGVHRCVVEQSRAAGSAGCASAGRSAMTSTRRSIDWVSAWAGPVGRVAAITWSGRHTDGTGAPTHGFHSSRLGVGWVNRTGGRVQGRGVGTGL
jgi:hypothetical protein